MKKTLVILIAIFVLASCGTSKNHCDAYGDANTDTTNTDLAYEAR